MSSDTDYGRMMSRSKILNGQNLNRLVEKKLMQNYLWIRYSRVFNRRPVRLFRTFCYSKRKRQYCLSLLK